SDTDLTRLMKMVDGHPYLVRVALYHIATCSITLEELLQTAPTEAGLYGDHLYRHLLLLEENPRLKKAMLDLVGSDRPLRLEPVVSFKLKSMGLAKSVGNELMPLCDLYRLYFGDRLVD
ncbi:MAG: AAA-like domain-containing protein, partial [Cyanobacteria bacterium P01_H01_bin.130]